MFIIPALFNFSFLGVSFLLIKSGFKQINEYHKVTNLATSKIKSLAAGEVEIKGNINYIPGKVFTSPLKKIKCVSYKFDAYEWIRRKKNSGWRRIYSKTESSPFYL